MDEIKANDKSIISFDIMLNESSTEDDIIKFLNFEMKIEDKNIIDKFMNINGSAFINLKEEDLVKYKFKLGERKKLKYYLNEIRKNTTNEICKLLEEKFQVTAETLEIIKENEITWEDFYELSDDDYETYFIEDEIKNKIKEYIKEIKAKKIKEENYIQLEDLSYKVYHLIEIKEYYTSQNDINRCPFNKMEEFASLCKDLNIKEKLNCTEIDYDFANKIKLKVVSLWGTKEGIIDFFEKNRITEGKNYFEEKNKVKSGIFLLIREDKSLGYIVIWPGEMDFSYTKMDQPQKGFLLNLIRMGLHLCNDSVICLSEKQQNEFDFQAIQNFNSKSDFGAPTKGKVKIFQNKEETFKIEGDIIIEGLEEMNENIKNIKLNGNSIFITFNAEEKIEKELKSNIPLSNINFKDENIILSNEFNRDFYSFFIFLGQFNIFKKDENVQKFLDKYEKNLNQIKEIKEIKENFNNYLSEYIENKKKTLEKLNSENNDNNLETIDKETIYYRKILEELKSIQFLNKNKYITIKNHVKDIIDNFFVNKKFTKDNFLIEFEDLKEKIEDLIEEKKEIILQEDKNFPEFMEKAEKLKKEVIQKLNGNLKKNYATINNWIEIKSLKIIKGEILLTFNENKKIIPKDYIKLFNLYKMDNESIYKIKEKQSPKLWEEDNFENYFEIKDGDGVTIKKENSFFKLNYGNLNFHFNGCYDYDQVNGIFISTKNEEDYQKFLIIYKFNQKDRYPKAFNSSLISLEKIIKIIIIPFIYDNIDQYALFFSSNKIYLVNLDTGGLISEYELDKKFSKFKMEDFQFLIYEKFLIIIHYNDNKQLWICEIFNICPDDEQDKFKNLERDAIINAPRKCQFSICSKKNEVLLYYIINLDKFNTKIKYSSSS